MVKPADDRQTFSVHEVARFYYLREYLWGILSGMSVPLTLLGLLERGPSHGYDLKRDTAARLDQLTGAVRS